MLAVDDVQPGVLVQTPLGKGTVREVLNGGRVRVEIGARTVVFRTSAVSRAVPDLRRDSPPRQSGQTLRPPSPDHLQAREIDLHGLTVDEAIARVDEVLNDALLAGIAELRLIHGRSGGRIRGAIHKRLRAISAVASFRIDPRNPGVTVVSL